MTDAADVPEGELQERSLGSVLAAQPGTLPQPPAPPITELPICTLAPPVVERLVAEIAMRTEGMTGIRVYGRSGQIQRGLDLLGGPVGARTVFQVRNINHLTPSRLRNLGGCNTDEDDAELRALTLQKLDDHRLLPLEGLARHPAPLVREVVAVLWGRRGDRAPGLAAVLARDRDRRVRRTLALVLAQLGADQPGGEVYEPLQTQMLEWRHPPRLRPPRSDATSKPPRSAAQHRPRHPLQGRPRLDLPHAVCTSAAQ